MRDAYGVLHGPKLQVSEILHLRAKKRTVVPLFKLIDTDDYDTGLYSLTPYGQGYVHYETIAEKSTGEAISTKLNHSAALTLREL
jgi:hypothetical protein